MARMIIVIAIALVALPLGGPSSASAEPERWAWFDASPLGDGWDIHRGEAEVEMQGEKFLARLYENGRLAITLRGTVKNGRVEATPVLHNTDANSKTKLAGQHGRVRWKDRDLPRREAILLSQPGQPWGWTIGLTRQGSKP